jgi:RimJ/RimL family protein N-acetyltransferase
MIILNRINETDLDQLQKWRNDERIYKWCRQSNLISDEDQANWYKKQQEDKSMRMFSIYVQDPFEDCGFMESLVGVCGLTDIDLINRRAEFSLYIGPGYQGRGYAKEALNLLFDHGFNTLGLNVIWGETFEGNKAINLFKKFGMRVEGTRRQFYFKEGSFIDAHLISITREEYLDLQE